MSRKMEQDEEPEDHKSPVLYDAGGKPIVRATDRSVPAKAQSSKWPIKRTKPQGSSEETKKSPWRRWLKMIALAVELCTILGVALGIYTLRPVLSLSSPGPSDLHGYNGAKLLITNGGWGIKDVTVQCFTTKVVFNGKYALAFDRFALVDEYSVPSVSSGESFPADCNFAWTFWTKPPSAIFIAGAGESGPLWGISMLLGDDGFPMVKPGEPVPGKFVNPDLTAFTYWPITAIDGTFVIRYRWPAISWFHKRTIHVIARRVHGGDLVWRLAPESEPVIPNPEGSDAWTVTAAGKDGQWGIKMKRATPP